MRLFERGEPMIEFYAPLHGRVQGFHRRGLAPEEAVTRETGVENVYDTLRTPHFRKKKRNNRTGKTCGPDNSFERHHENP